MCIQGPELFNLFRVLRIRFGGRPAGLCSEAHGTNGRYLLDSFLVAQNFITWCTLLAEPEHPSVKTRRSSQSSDQILSQLSNTTNIRIFQGVCRWLQAPGTVRRRWCESWGSVRSCPLGFIVRLFLFGFSGRRICHMVSVSHGRRVYEEAGLLLVI